MSILNGRFLSDFFSVKIFLEEEWSISFWKPHEAVDAVSTVGAQVFGEDNSIVFNCYLFLFFFNNIFPLDFKTHFVLLLLTHSVFLVYYFMLQHSSSTAFSFSFFPYLLLSHIRAWADFNNIFVPLCHRIRGFSKIFECVLCSFFKLCLFLVDL